MKNNRLIACNSGLHAEVITAVAFKGKVKRSIGYDVLTSRNQRIEVRSRKVFTDGRQPRLTLNKSKMENSDIIVAIHYERDLEISMAIAIRTKSLEGLYYRYLQKSGKQAHINWNEIINHSDVIDITNKLRGCDKSVRGMGYFNDI